ncbi:MAG: glycosyltransferase family 4 protein [Candidatus Acidiferrales bacterium]
MKLLLYSHFFAPSIGGVETVVLSLATGLSQCSRSQATGEFELTLVTQAPRGSFDDSSLPFAVVRQPSFNSLRKLIRSANVIHVAGAAISPILLGLVLRKPVVVEHHGFQTICPTGQLYQEPENIPCPGHFMAERYTHCLACAPTPKPFASFRLWLLTFLRRFLCQHVAVNITPTNWLSGMLQLPRTETVPHGLQISPPLVRLPASHPLPVLVFLGRIVTTKGLLLLLEAARLLQQQNRPIELKVVGDGPERAALQKLTEEWKLAVEVHFLGRLPDSQIADLLATADLLVVPSLGGEVFGMVIAENMFRGIPILASDLGAFVEVLGDAGRTFKTGDSADLARQILQLLDDPAASRQLGVAAHQRVRDFFPLSRMIEGHAQIYRRLAPDGTA